MAETKIFWKNDESHIRLVVSIKGKDCKNKLIFKASTKEELDFMVVAHTIITYLNEMHIKEVEIDKYDTEFFKRHLEEARFSVKYLKTKAFKLKEK